MKAQQQEQMPLNSGNVAQEPEQMVQAHEQMIQPSQQMMAQRSEDHDLINEEAKQGASDIKQAQNDQTDLTGTHSTGVNSPQLQSGVTSPVFKKV